MYNTDNTMKNARELFAMTEKNALELIVLRNGSPQWMTDVLSEARGDEFPTNWAHNTIETLLDQITDLDEDSRYRDIEEKIYEMTDNLADTDLTKLLAWLQSDLTRAQYVNEALEELPGKDLNTILANGQQLQIERIAYHLIHALRNADTQED